MNVLKYLKYPVIKGFVAEQNPVLFMRDNMKYLKNLLVRDNEAPKRSRMNLLRTTNKLHKCNAEVLKISWPQSEAEHLSSS